MLVLINKYLRSKKNTQAGRDEMAPPAAASTTGADRDRDRDLYHCLPGCVPVRAKRRSAAASSASAAAVTTTTTARTSRHNFVRAAASGLLAGAHFTNHESLPALPDAYADFAVSFPLYGAAPARADAIRGEEYPHLDRHVCLDYTGINLFSHAQMNSSLPSTSAPAAPAWQPPFFDIAYKSASLRAQVQCEKNDAGAAASSGVGAAVTRRIMKSLKIPEDEYAMVCTANRTTAFRLLAESYSFGGSSGGRQLLPVYDYESEAASAMADSARRRGAEVVPASFAWPSMRIHGADLRKKLCRGGRRRRRGLFVFPLASRMTGARYPYLWMSAAHEQGWHVALDACALGTKDLDTFGLSLIRPDFIVCNFFKVFGENPSGFAGLFVRRSTGLAALERSVIARSIGIVTIVPARRWSLHDGAGGDYSTDLEHSRSLPLAAALDDADVETTSSFSGPLSSTTLRSLQPDAAAAENGDAPEIREENGFLYYQEEPGAENGGGGGGHGTEPLAVEEESAAAAMEEMEVECRGLDHADALGLIAIGNRLRCISNWLVVALQKLRHPHAAGEGNAGSQLVRLYGPRVKFDRGPSLAFNVFDWKGERVAPALVQKLADRHNISLTCGFLRNIWFADKYDADRAAVLEHRDDGGGGAAVAAPGPGKRSRKDGGAGGDVGILVVNASLGFLSNFEDAYRLWAFVAKFLDADFVEKERWRYTALNQRTVEV